MIVFSVDVEDVDSVHEFLRRSRLRLGVAIAGKIKTVELPDGCLRVFVLIKPMFPPLWRYVAPMMLASLLIFTGFKWSWWLLIPAFTLMFEFSARPFFHRFLFVRGLKRAGYIGSVTYPSSDAFNDYLLEVL